MVSLLKKTGNSTRILLPPLSNQHSNKAFDDVYNQRNREVHGRVATFIYLFIYLFIIFPQ